MLAVRYYGIGDIRVENIPKPAPGHDEVLVKVAYAGICGSDLHIFRKGMFISSAPVTMGHEFSGVVEEVGAGVTGLRPGDQVVGDPRVPCGRCQWCRREQYNLCPGLGFIGEVRPGCFAEHIAINYKKLLKVPALDLKEAVLVEPLAVAVHIAKKGKLSPENTVGILGAGPIGLLTLAAAKAIRVREVIVVDPSPARLEIARKIGADSAVAAIPEDPADLADVVVEAAGTGSALAGALKWLKPGGRLVMAGIYEDRVQLDPNNIINRELKIAGINAYETDDLKSSAEMLAGGKVNIAPIVSLILPLESAAEGFSLLTSPSVAVGKILLAP
ncbi:MAG: alcohol dehydrogenase catalytic domain-containing protein [Pelotomaculum sp.]|nr:alcohol dehydrogenase catalytic domain-containing protein [Pelotomaculum sp.]